MERCAIYRTRLQNKKQPGLRRGCRCRWGCSCLARNGHAVWTCCMHWQEDVLVAPDQLFTGCGVRCNNPIVAAPADVRAFCRCCSVRR